MQNYTGYAGDFIMQSHVLVCCSWRNDGYIKVAVLIPTAKPMVSPSLFVKEINFKLPSTDYTNDEAKICYDTESLKVVMAGYTNVHTHAAITNVLVARQNSKDMSGPMTQMSDSQKM